MNIKHKISTVKKTVVNMTAFLQQRDIFGRSYA